MLYLLLCEHLLFCVCFLFCVFFFKQKTAYEMRISDWSSDVCSSDLEPRVQRQLEPSRGQGVSSEGVGHRAVEDPRLEAARLGLREPFVEGAVIVARHQVLIGEKGLEIGRAHV